MNNIFKILNSDQNCDNEGVRIMFKIIGIRTKIDTIKGAICFKIFPKSLIFLLYSSLVL